MQQRIDDVVGLDRLPTFADQALLPVVEATVRGTMSCAEITSIR